MYKLHFEHVSRLTDEQVGREDVPTRYVEIITPDGGTRLTAFEDKATWYTTPRAAFVAANTWVRRPTTKNAYNFKFWVVPA